MTYSMTNRNDGSISSNEVWSSSTNIANRGFRLQFFTPLGQLLNDTPVSDFALSPTHNTALAMLQFLGIHSHYH